MCSLRKCISVLPVFMLVHPLHDQLNAKDAHIEKVLLLCEVTTKVLLQ